ncbi:MAG: hypothetical protein EOM55_02575 [Clostridia bacterium]|nr:hypothetical protein [Clostridia bacterium]
MTNTLKENLTKRLNEISTSLDLVLNGLVYRDNKTISLRVKNYIMSRKVMKREPGYVLRFTSKKGLGIHSVSISARTEEKCRNKAYDLYLKGMLDLSFFFYKEMKILISNIEKTTLFFDTSLKGENI